jgi:alanyl-tRNA synthetase
VKQNNSYNHIEKGFDIAQAFAELSRKKYGIDESIDIAMRVIADHIRAVTFSIADGQLPSNNKAGYVIRRILRRAVRYAYTFLDIKEPFMFELVAVLANQFDDIFPEIKAQHNLIRKVIIEEEQSFLRTLSFGIQKFENYLNSDKNIKQIDGKFAFELFDTFGFPVDLTQLMAKEAGLNVDMSGFQKCMSEQKQRSRADAQVDTLDWVVISDATEDSNFVGYDTLNTQIKIVKYRKVIVKGKEKFQLVFDKTPFYAEAGGQIGDIGYIEANGIKTFINDTRKENNLTVHFTDILPLNIYDVFTAQVDVDKRLKITNNHTATHLLHYALREILGKHIEQKGSLVESERLRFDFSHFQKMKSDEIQKVENLVNNLIRQNISISEFRNIAMDEAVSMGAMALFGEKYGEKVRVIKFDNSVELCGGVHVNATGQIGLFKIVSESAVAAGIRRIEAVSGAVAENFVNDKIMLLNEISSILKNPPDILKAVTHINSEISVLNKKIEEFNKEKTLALIPDLMSKMTNLNGVKFLSTRLDYSSDTIKDLSFGFKNQCDNFILIIGSNFENKVILTVMLSDNLVQKGLDASVIVRTLAKEISGGGGGQKFYAVAGGKNPDGLDKAIALGKEVVESYFENN